jgi:hypothetical protein
VWFNSRLHEEPYLGLTCTLRQAKACVRKGKCTGAAWLSSARVVRCSVKSENERNPQGELHVSNPTARENREEGADDVKSAWPLCPGLHTRYNGRYNGRQPREGKRIPKAVRSSDCRLQLACMKLELLVTVGQRYYGEYVPGPCTHRPSRHGSWSRLKCASEPQGSGV